MLVLSILVRFIKANVFRSMPYPRRSCLYGMESNVPIRGQDIIPVQNLVIEDVSLLHKAA